MIFHPTEKICSAIIVALFCLDAILIPYRGVGVDWAGYLSACAVGIGAIALGQYYRLHRFEEGIALATTASGLFILFTIAGSIFNYMLLPVGDRRIDPLLILLDAGLGFSWSGTVVYFAQMPWLAWLLGKIYVSSLPQLILVILILGFSGQRDRLHQFLLTGIFGALAAILLWAVFPSSGPAAYETLPTAIAKSFDLIVETNYGAELNRLALEGPSYISPRDALGLIAFPSFHTVMACMAVWAMSRMRIMFPFVLALNILMLPAILLHGGHHLVDVIGGGALFAVALLLSGRIVAAINRPDLALSRSS